jgi:predicted transposase YbfD/YdcC
MLPRADDTLKQTNEIGMVIPLLDTLPLNAKTLTADALLTQRKLAAYLLERGAHYVFTVKDNQPNLLADLRLAFAQPGAPQFEQGPECAHGRIETRRIWTTTALNRYLDFPGVGQAFCIERHVVDKRTGKTSLERVYGITSHAPETANAERVLTLNRRHWCIENSCHWIIDWNFDEDRSTIRTGFGPENVTRLRRFAVGLIKAVSSDSVAATLRRLQRNPRLVFDYLRMTENSTRRQAWQGGLSD